MSLIDINTIKENDIVRFIAPNKSLFDGVIKKVFENCIGITIDSRQDSSIKLNKGQSIELILVNGRQAIKCASTVLGCNQNGFEQAIIINIPKFILSIDRRGFERLSIVMDIEYSLLPNEVNYSNLNSVEAKYFRQLKKTYTINISGGGVYFIVPKNELENKFALVSMYLKDEKIMALCERVRKDKIDDHKHDGVAFMYNDINAQHRQLILDFVSEKSKENNKS